MKKPLKITSIACLLVLLAAGILYAATELQYFTGKNESDSILLEWKTGTEDNLNRFEIERSASEPNNYVNIGSVTAIGSNSYYYFRDNASAMNSVPVYYYRLKLVDNNGNYVYSQTITVTHVISSVRDTWGSIKAIFR
ncbi:MAG: Bacillopeptidase F [Chlorobi bacterium OLB5]|nr:MAG: Bacillopeptidase F [Chlorobi bacterium OLB5]